MPSVLVSREVLQNKKIKVVARSKVVSNNLGKLCILASFIFSKKNTIVDVFIILLRLPGQGWDRHLFAMRALAASESFPMPNIFTDPNYIKINQVSLLLKLFYLSHSCARSRQNKTIQTIIFELSTLMAPKQLWDWVKVACTIKLFTALIYELT
jgi:hypothetical protein